MKTNLRNIWNSAGENIESAKLLKDALSLSHLDWEVVKSAAKVKVKGKLVDIPSFCAIVRTDILEPLSVVTNRTEIFQNSEIFAFIDEILETGFARFYFGGLINKGETTWLLLRTDEEIRVGANNTYRMHVLVTNNHDSNKSFFIQNVFLREESATTFPLTEIARIRKIDADRVNPDGVIAFLIREKENLNKTFHELYRAKVLSARPIVEKIVPSQGDPSTRTQNIRGSILRRVRGKTKLDLLNAVSEFVDHDRATRIEGDKIEEEVRFESCLLGAGSAMKRRSLLEIKKY